MANPLFVRTIVVAAVVAGAGLGCLGIANGTLPLKTLLAHLPREEAPALPAPAVADIPGPELAAEADVEEVALNVPPREAPSLTRNSVIASTFAALPAATQTQPAAPGDKVAEAVPVTAPLTSRTVRVISVGPDGTPDFSAGAPTGGLAYAEPGRAATPDVPALDAATQIGAGQTPVAPVPAPMPKAVEVANADPSGPSGTITGSGANVRSNPSKGNNQVLFALAGGSKVTLGERRNGWVHVTDAQGRSGWVYAEYVTR